MNRLRQFAFHVGKHPLTELSKSVAVLVQNCKFTKAWKKFSKIIEMELVVTKL